MHLFCFGLGYSAQRFVDVLARQGWQISGTTRSEAKASALAQQGITPVMFQGTHPIHPSNFEGVTHVLHSIPPSADGDAVFTHCREVLESLKLEWFGYLSTTGVYGDTGGEWVDEISDCHPTSERSKHRLAAEEAWQNTHLPWHIFRLAGIYGPKRNSLRNIEEKTAKCVDKPGHVFSRIHVEDIAEILYASVNQPKARSIYNCADDAPVPQPDPVRYASELMGILPPEAVPFEAAELSPMARSFYQDNRKISNHKIKEELGVVLRYPTYREGLKALFAKGAPF
jgi:nucleoside-diphosphate-sugar epimerase